MDMEKQLPEALMEPWNVCEKQNYAAQTHLSIQMFCCKAHMSVIHVLFANYSHLSMRQLVLMMEMAKSSNLMLVLRAPSEFGLNDAPSSLCRGCSEQKNWQLRSASSTYSTELVCGLMHWRGLHGLPTRTMVGWAKNFSGEIFS